MASCRRLRAARDDRHRHCHRRVWGKPRGADCSRCRGPSSGSHCRGAATDAAAAGTVAPSERAGGPVPGAGTLSDTIEVLGLTACALTWVPGAVQDPGCGDARELRGLLDALAQIELPQVLCRNRHRRCCPASTGQPRRPRPNRHRHHPTLTTSLTGTSAPPQTRMLAAPVTVRKPNADRSAIADRSIVLGCAVIGRGARPGPCRYRRFWRRDAGRCRRPAALRCYARRRRR